MNNGADFGSLLSFYLILRGRKGKEEHGSEQETEASPR